MGNPTARNHYLPKFYLERFCDASGRVLRTFKGPDNELHETRFAPKATGFEEHLYSLLDAGLLLREPRIDVIERDVLGPIDAAGANALADLLDSAPLNLSDASRRGWASFVNSLLVRHPQGIRQGDARAIEVARERMAVLRKHFGPPQDGRIDVFDLLDADQYARNAHRGHVSEKLLDQERIDYLQSFVLVKVTAPAASPVYFVTGDNPVFSNGLPLHWFALSLDPRTLLVGHRPQETVDHETLAALAVIHNLELLAQCEYIFSRDPLVDAPWSSYRGAGREHLNPVQWRRT